MIGRVSTFSQTLYVLDLSLQSQARLADVQAQTASGLKSQTFGGFGWSSGTLVRHEADRTAATAEAAAATSALAVAEQAYAALGAIGDLAETVLSSVADSGAETGALAGLAEGWLDDLESLLNSRYGDQALFAGAAVQDTAVDFDDWSPSDPAAYYKGSAEPRAFTSADGRSIPLSVTADDPALASLVSVLTGLASGAVSGAEALDIVQAAASQIGALRTTLTSSASRLERVAEQGLAKAEAIGAILATMKETDLAEAAVLAKQYETLLQTGYSTLNILMSVKLSDYLRG